MQLASIQISILNEQTNTFSLEKKISSLILNYFTRSIVIPKAFNFTSLNLKSKIQNNFLCTRSISSLVDMTLL